MSEKTCPQCAETVKAEAKICRFCQYNFETGQSVDTVVGAVPPKKSSKIGKGCLIVLGIFVAVIVLGAIVGGNEKGGSASAPTSSEGQKQASDVEEQVSADEDPGSSLTGPQRNAARSAEQYISMSGFSRDGLIEQLSSDAGNGYAVADATAAVDSLSIDWKEQAARSAEQYLKMSGFSCKGLIEQLSSTAGNKYTVSDATYGAKKAGAC